MPPTLTALRRAGPGRIALELDGRPWRTVPDAVVVRAGLARGLELDRETLRLVRRELARARGLATAGRMLARGDVSSRRLTARVERTAGAAAGEVVSALADAGLVDDGRASAARASALAARGWGDAAIEARLEGEGFDPVSVRAALAALGPEEERAGALVARERDPVRAARLLARRGFAPDLVEETAGSLDFGPGSGLGCADTSDTQNACTGTASPNRTPKQTPLEPEDIENVTASRQGERTTRP